MFPINYCGFTVHYTLYSSLNLIPYVYLSLYTVYNSSYCIHTSAECRCVQDPANQEIVEILTNPSEDPRSLYPPKGAKRCKEVQNCAKSLIPEEPAGFEKLDTLRKCDIQVDWLSSNGYSLFSPFLHAINLYLQRVYSGFFYSRS